MSLLFGYRATTPSRSGTPTFLIRSGMSSLLQKHSKRRAIGKRRFFRSTLVTASGAGSAYRPNCHARNNRSAGKIGSEHMLVMSCQPFRQIDIKVCLAIACISAREIRQWTASAVEHQDQTLHKHKCRQQFSHKDSVQNSRDWNACNTTNEEEPGGGVQSFDSRKRTIGYCTWQRNW